ncbi:MAG TPA: polyphosphate kinase 1, partial [Bdellovibrionota bacterium]|nr:polyphosphate kinase 1 [Bdellovibrionota bacterium]
ASLNRSIQSQVRRGQYDRAKQGKRIRQQIVESVRKMAEEQNRVLDKLKAELARHSIHIVSAVKPLPEAEAIARKVFEEHVLPLVDRERPRKVAELLELGNLQLAAVFADGEICYPLPKSLPAALITRDEEAGKTYLFFLDYLVLAFLGPALGIQSPASVARLTRDGDVTVELDEEEDPESIPDVVHKQLTRRDFGRPIRLQILGNPTPAFIQAAQRSLKIDEDVVFRATRTLCLHGLWSIRKPLNEELARDPHLSYPALKPVMPPEFDGARPVIEILKERDILLHHPYESFDAFVAWVEEACRDKNVTQIDLTVYRTDAVSPVVDALKKSAKKKKIRVLIELRARFDELNNLKLAEELKRAGIDVAFGFGELKLHAKIALVTRYENGTPRFYTHLSTGNYNAVTARQYTDIALLTGNQEIGNDARLFFESIWDGEVPSAFKKLVSAPARLRRRILGHIDHEVKAARDGHPAHIVAKVNALVDEDVIESLYRASQAGVRVDLIVRGACSLIPGVQGLSENIRVISIVDRFLEHSRIYYFEHSRVMYLSSADWMPRNFFSRLEIAFPVLDPRIFSYLEKIVIPTYLRDTVKARELQPSGKWIPCCPKSSRETPLRSQFRLQELATLRASEASEDR